MQVAVTVSSPDARRAGQLASEQAHRTQGWARVSVMSTRPIGPGQFEVVLVVSGGPGVRA